MASVFSASANGQSRLIKWRSPDFGGPSLLWDVLEPTTEESEPLEPSGRETLDEPPGMVIDGLEPFVMDGFGDMGDDEMFGGELGAMEPLEPEEGAELPRHLVLQQALLQRRQQHQP
jgi:hypothetical protein